MIYLSLYPCFYPLLSLLLPSSFILSIYLSIPTSPFAFLLVSRPVVSPRLFCTLLARQAGFPAGEASEEEKKEQLQRERNTDSHQGDPQEEGRVVLQTAGVDFLFLFSFVNYWDVYRDNE